MLPDLILKQISLAVIDLARYRAVVECNNSPHCLQLFTLCMFGTQAIKELLRPYSNHLAQCFNRYKQDQT